MRSKYTTFVVILFLLTFSIRLTNNAISITIPLISKYELNFPIIFLGILLSAFSFTSFLSSILNSKLEDRTRTKVFRIASIIYLISFISFYITNRVLIWILDCIAGFSIGIIWPNLITYAGSVDEEIREKVIGLYSAFLSLSLIVGPAIESFILLKYSLNDIFLFLSIIAVIIPIVSFKIEFNDLNLTQNKNNERIIRSPAFIMTLLNNIMYDIPFGMISTFGGIYAISHFNASYSLAELIYAIFFIISFFTRLFFSFIISKNTNIIKIISFNAILTVIGLSLILLSNSIIYYILALIILGIPHGLTYYSSLILLSRNFSERNRANSYFSGTLLGLGSVGPFFLSSIVEGLGIRNTFLLITFGVISIFTVLLYLYSKK
ncbi:MFS transporter [Acidianus manzaensis]|uniref:MFS transporter n=1 Tax=Acidianus manzaensis TaxID=282676 RepID=UPI00165058A7|nr:MFS transporter [Acidianus manzaensis]